MENSYKKLGCEKSRILPAKNQGIAGEPCRQKKPAATILKLERTAKVGSNAWKSGLWLASGKAQNTAQTTDLRWGVWLERGEMVASVEPTLGRAISPTIENFLESGS